MTDRDKIIKIVMEAKWHDIFGDHHGICEPIAEAIADSLIANGYGNVAELKVELRSKIDYIHELWEVKEDYKYKAEIHKQALKNTIFDLLNICCMLVDFGGEEELCKRYDLDKLSNIRERLKQADRELKEAKNNENL